MLMYLVTYIVFSPMGKCKNLEKKFLFFLAWSCRSLHTESQDCFQSSFSRWNIKCAAFGLEFKYSVKMQPHVLYDRPRMLQILSTVSHLFSWITWHAFYTFTTVWLYDVCPQSSKHSTQIRPLLQGKYQLQWNLDLSFPHWSFFRMYCSQSLVPN